MNKITSSFIRTLLIITMLCQSLFTSTFAQSYNFDLQAKGECGFITLSWNPIPGASFYWIYRGSSQEAIHPMPLTDFPIEATSYVDENDIILEQEYFYYVTAVGPDKEEFARSLIVSATPTCDRVTPVPPIPPCKLVLKYQVGNTLYWVNEDSHGPMDTAPLILYSRMFLVIRYVTNPIQGTSIAWDGTERKVTITTRTGTRIELWIGNPQARINGNPVAIDPNNAQVVPVIKDGRTLLPLRFVAENLGAESVEDILWDASTQTVQLFIDDPQCDQEGFRYPKATPLQSAFYEFSIEYHTRGDLLPTHVRLILARADNTKTLRLGPSKSRGKDLELELLKTPQASYEDIKTSFKLARRYYFRLELIPGMLHFYRFTADEKESHPTEGYLGPIYATLPGSERLENLKLDQIKDGTSLNVQGFFTYEPYPMLVSDYWKIHELAENNDDRILLQLDKGDKIQEGSFVCIKVHKRTSTHSVPFMKFQKMIFSQHITQNKYVAKEVAMEPLLPSLIRRHRFALVYSGCIDEAKIRDTSGNLHVYRRARADFSGEILNCYKTCFSLGIPKTNIYVNFGRGDEEIDYMCADDGDGNPFDFDWDDAEFRNTMERDAERWWRADDDWRLRRGTRAALYESINLINNKIKELPADVTPEVYIFIFTHGNIGGLCSYEDGGLSYSNLIPRLSPLMENSSIALHGRTKIRFSNNTCKAGAIIPHVNDAFRLSGLDYFQLAVSSKADELSWGQWPAHEETSYASAGGTFGIPFRASLIEQAQVNSNREVDWKVAYDYAAINDVYVSGVEHEKDDGTTHMVYVHPQYWNSRDRGFYQRGPGFEDPLSPEDEIRSSLVRIGVDTSEAVLDVCNCSMSPSYTIYPATSFRIVNRGIVPFRVVEIRANESSLSKTTSRPTFIFRATEYDSSREQSPISFNLSYEESRDIEIKLHSEYLNAQPIDENGYMLSERNLPVFISVPITIVYESGSKRYPQEATIPLRVRGKSYQLRYKTSVKRVEKIKGELSIWEDLNPAVKVSPAIAGLPENVLAGPLNNGEFHLNLSTDIFKKSADRTIAHSYLKAFKLDLLFDFLGEQDDCHGDYDYWGRVVSATLPHKLKGKMQVTYPSILSTDNISITITPDAHSWEGMQSLIGKHTFQFHIRRITQYECEYRSENFFDIYLTIDLEFTDP